ncbi:MAG: cysteine synthase family protein [Chitinophagales bacterium]
MTAIQISSNSGLIKRINEIEHLIGNTPLLEIRNAYRKRGVRIFAKLEWQQLGNSVKARPAFNIFKQAILNGKIKAGMHLLDATSGNTGIAYASIGAALGVNVTLCLPENASQERKLILKSLGTNITYTSRFEATDGSQVKALEMKDALPEQYYYADQYANDNNWKAHYYTTAEEIYQQTNGTVTHFVAGLGTTGTFVGTSRKLQLLNPNIQTVSLQPELALHGMEGWKHLETAKVPKIYDSSIANQNLTVDTMESYEWIKRFARKEGILLSPSAAANLAGAVKVAEQIEEGVIVTVFPDNADKYGEVLKHIFG